jgi:hypothetical protein
MQGDKHFMPQKDQENRDFMARYGLTSVVVAELRDSKTAVELGRLASNPETCFWRMYLMRKRFMDGCKGALCHGDHDSKSRSWEPRSDDEEDEHIVDDDENESIVH